MMWVHAERLGSGDGERKTLLTRQMAFEPLPASVLFAFSDRRVVMPVKGSQTALVQELRSLPKLRRRDNVLDEW